MGVESADGPAMKRSVEAGELVTLERCDTIVDGLRVKRVGEHTFDLVQRFVDEIVDRPGRRDLRERRLGDDALQARRRGSRGRDGRGAALGQIEAEPGTKVVCVLSGGNLDVSQLAGLRWN